MAETPIKQNKIVPVVMLYPHPRNYRQHPPSQIQKIKASLERFGQGRSIVVQGNADTTYTIVAGHGVFEAAQGLGWTELRADILPPEWTDDQVTGYLVADNNLSKGASDDDELLAELLQAQSNAGYDLASLGTDAEELRQMLEALGDGYIQNDGDERGGK
jgi:ParB-like chromosome segregation protein Spo0J